MRLTRQPSSATSVSYWTNKGLLVESTLTAGGSLCIDLFAISNHRALLLPAIVELPNYPGIAGVLFSSPRCSSGYLTPWEGSAEVFLFSSSVPLVFFFFFLLLR